jgi:hypothetical protein
VASISDNLPIGTNPQGGHHASARTPGPLFLSHRTVGTHLYRVFPKLGITSRAALRDALTAL